MSQIPCLIAMVRKSFFQLVPVFPTGIDLSWIPDGAQPIAQGISGTLNGSNKVFQCSSTNPTVFRNGQLQTLNGDYTNSNGTITFVNAPAADDVLLEMVGFVSQSGGPVRYLVPLEAPDGVRTAFTFAFAPTAIVYNGITRQANSSPGYSLSGLIVTFPDAPVVTDQILGVY